MLIYLASPYTPTTDAERRHPTTTKHSRYLAAVAATAAIMQAGGHVISPIASIHPVAERHALPGDWSYWQALDYALISACAEVWVLCIDGFDRSTGVREETRYAAAHGKTIRYVDPSDPAQPLRDAPTAAPAPPTAGIKHDAGKLRFDLIPVEPLREIARVYTIGAAKYADRNWERGIAWGRVFAAMCRHAFAWWGGEQLDPVDGQHHLASVAWCAMALIEYERTHPELDDSAPRSAP